MSNESNLAPLLVAAGLTSTFGRKPDGTEVDGGPFTPGSPLASPAASEADIQAALDARYGKGMGALATGAGEASVDLSPLYVAHGWPFPVTATDLEDLKRVKGAVQWAMAAIAALDAPPPPPVSTSDLVHAHAAALAHFALVFPGIRSEVIARHGTVNPAIRTAIFNAFAPALSAAAENGIIDETGRVVG